MNKNSLFNAETKKYQGENMKIRYLGILAVLVLLVGCAAKETPTTPAAPAAPEAPVAPAEETAAAAEAEEPAAAGGDIQILKKAFEPAELTVSVGSTVKWVNMDETARHSLSIVGKGVICNRKAAGEACEYAFEEAGTYEILDLINKFTGTVIVK